MDDTPTRPPEDFPAAEWITNVAGALNEAGNDLHRLAGRLSRAADDGQRWRIIAGKLASIRRLAALVQDLHDCLEGATPDIIGPR